MCPVIDGVLTTFDETGDCLIGVAPPNQPAWIWNNGFYYTDIPEGYCPYKPFHQSMWDTANCYVAKIPDGFYG